MKISKIRFSKIRQYYKMIRSYENPIKFMVAVILSVTNLSKFFTIKRNGYKLIFHPSAISINYFISKGARSNDEEILNRILFENDNYVDVGANIGALALKAKSIVKNGIIIAIEAHPRTFSYLKSNFDFNKFDNCTLLNCGAGNEKGKIRFSDSNSDDQNHVVENSGIEIEVDTLDNILEKIDRIDLLKIDVEGFEKQVILGGGNTLKRTRNILIEVSDENFKRYNYCTADLLTILDNYNFVFYVIKKDFSIHKLNNFKTYGATTVHNIICTKNEEELLKYFSK